MPSLSVIIPVYNTEKYLENCINSILTQDYMDWEMILIDDGSSDRSACICDNYAGIDERIIVVHTINKGQSVARNIGMSLAKGEFITFVDSDDDISSDTFSANMSVFDRFPQVEVVQYPVFEGFGEEDGTIVSLGPILYNDNRAIQLAFLDQYPKVTSSVCNKIFRREILQDCKFNEGHLHEDYLFIDILTKKLKKLYVSDKGCYHYYHRPQSTTHTKNASRYIDLLNCDISRLKRRYDFSELKHLLLEQYIFVIREWQNIRFEFCEIDIQREYDEIQRLRPPLKCLFLTSPLKNKIWLLFLYIIGLNPFTHFYQWLLRVNHKS